MAIKNNVSLVLGSATPSIEEYYKAKNGEYELIEIKSRANKKPLPKIQVVDMKSELNNGNTSIFSISLQREIEKAINDNILKPIKKPDLDNIAKNSYDILNGILYKDDAQIISSSIRKHYVTNENDEDTVFDIKIYKNEKLIKGRL